MLKVNKIDLRSSAFSLKIYTRCLMFYQIIKAGNDEIGLVWEDAGEKHKLSVFIFRAGKRLSKKSFGIFPLSRKSRAKYPAAWIV